MEVCEGQHRLEAYRSLGMPITYIIKEGLDIFDIRKMNSTSRLSGLWKSIWLVM